MSMSISNASQKCHYAQLFNVNKSLDSHFARFFDKQVLRPDSRKKVSNKRVGWMEKVRVGWEKI